MARVCHIGLRQYRDMVKVSTPSSCPLRVRAQPGALSRVSPPPPDLPMQGPLGCPCFVVAPSDGGDGTRPAECATLRPVGDLPAATAAVLPEAIAVAEVCMAPSARHLPTLLSRPIPAGLSDFTACRRPPGPCMARPRPAARPFGVAGRPGHRSLVGGSTTDRRATIRCHKRFGTRAHSGPVGRCTPPGAEPLHTASPGRPPAGRRRPGGPPRRGPLPPDGCAA